MRKEAKYELIEWKVNELLGELWAISHEEWEGGYMELLVKLERGLMELYAKRARETFRRETDAN